MTVLKINILRYDNIGSFNESAAALWENFANKEFTAEDAAQFLVSRYGISVETATKDAGLWIGKLKDCGAIIE